MFENDGDVSPDARTEQTKMNQQHKQKSPDVVPSVLILYQSIQQNESKQLMRVLLDSKGAHFVHS